MNFSPKSNITAMIAVLWTFCIVSVLSSDTIAALRGSDSRSDKSKRNLANDKVSVYRCDSENQRITSTISNKTEVLEDAGLDLRICFQASRSANSDNLYILKIDEFIFTKDRINGDLAAAGPTRQIPAIMRQKAVDHGVAMSTDLTEIFCDPGSEICAFETRLTGYFFLTSGTIEGKGSVMMQRGRDERRELQDMDGFEDVYIELDFTGGGRSSIPPKTRIIIIVSIILGLLLLCCCFGILCCFLGLCCFAGREKRSEDTDEDNVEEVSVKIEWAPTVKGSKKRREDEDMSETESLEDDQYWDDDIALSEDGSESDDNSVESLDMESKRAAVVPIPEAKQESSSRKESKRNSRRNESTEDGDRWDDVGDSEEGNEQVDKSVEKLETENDIEEVLPIEGTEEESPKKSKRKKKRKD